MRKDDTSQTGEVYCDRRLGGRGKWYIGEPRDARMRVPDNFTHCVGFIAVKAHNEYGEYDHYIGTCFVVSTVTQAGGYYHYIVTARHTIEGARAKGWTEFFIRLNYLPNVEHGGGETLALPDRWEMPENPVIDVAVLQALIPTHIFQVTPIRHTGLFLRETAITQQALVLKYC